MAGDHRDPLADGSAAALRRRTRGVVTPTGAAPPSRWPPGETLTAGDAVLTDGGHPLGPLDETGLTVTFGAAVAQVADREGHTIVRPRHPDSPNLRAYRGTPCYPADPDWVAAGALRALPRARRRRRGRGRLRARRRRAPAGRVGRGRRQPVDPVPRRHVGRHDVPGQPPAADRAPVTRRHRRHRLQPGDQHALRLHRLRHLPGAPGGEHAAVRRRGGRADAGRWPSPVRVDAVPTYRACLVDVFDTVVSVDMPRYGASWPIGPGSTPARSRRLPCLGGAGDGGQRVAPPGDGRGAAGLRHHRRRGRARRPGGRGPRAPRRARRAARRRRAVPRGAARARRAHRVREQLRENTRPLLDRLGLAALVDELVLSCEVRRSSRTRRSSTWRSTVSGSVPASPCSWTTSRRTAAPPRRRDPGRPDDRAAPGCRVDAHRAAGALLRWRR